jgi:type IV secretion system protein VirB10
MPNTPEDNNKDFNSGSTEGKTGKLDPNDASLAIVKKSNINRKTIRIAVSIVGALILLGVMIGLSPHKPKTVKEKEQEKQKYSQQIPSDLAVNPGDYGMVKGEPVEAPQVEGYNYAPKPVGDQNSSVPQYQVYNRNPNPDQTVQYPTPQPSQSQNQPGQQNQQQLTQKNLPFSLNPMAGYVGPDEEAKRRLAALTSPFFFAWSSDEQKANQQSAQDSQPGSKATDAQTAAIQAAYESAYSKENMAEEKQSFLNSQKGDYSTYLDNHYITATDAAHLIQAGSIIPVIMETGIDSDLPGTVIAVVYENVFDSLTGQNILIPRGSKLIGNYDNQLSFGQNRVLVTWDRVIRTDGVSISLRGMPGTDLQGQAGLHDQVDYHLATILATVGAASLFDIGTNAAISALSTNQFLGSLAAAMTAQGSTSSNVTSAAQAAAIAYANKLVDQQPTVIIRSGTRGNCLVQKDMILPTFVDGNSAYTEGQ